VSYGVLAHHTKIIGTYWSIFGGIWGHFSLTPVTAYTTTVRGHIPGDRLTAQAHAPCLTTTTTATHTVGIVILHMSITHFTMEIAETSLFAGIGQ
jgi:hypothetical protein